ncbi:hypothetical protein K461DRAFT_279264 [Myriangium duriaei CBS 260.36]|uniref:Uncharacterized protein n=1 Tax=Myriangium duriaei CBS 260.36 TaxID=1168546 RepID=A0A9P4IXK2_9PEZI|nr:hypothetical protein K461DRAFT_279264 [Myriangium duriaei CBS 260.36]
MVAPAQAAARGTLSHIAHLDLHPAPHSAQKQKCSMELEQDRIHVMAGHGTTNTTDAPESFAYRHGKFPDGPLTSHSLQSIRSGLPPTPPQQNGEETDEPLMSPSVLSDIYQSAVTSPAMLVSTPIHLTSPPTPDTTPPSRRERLRVPRNDLTHYPSLSQADSFVTARETMHSQSSNRSQVLRAGSDGDTLPRSSRQPSPSSGTTAVASADYDIHGTTSSATVRSPAVRDSSSSRSHSHHRAPSRQTSDQLRPDMSMPEIQVNSPDQNNGGSKARTRVQDNGIDSGGSSSASPPRKPRHRRRAASTTTAPSASANSLTEQALHDTAISHDALYTQLRDEKSKRLSGHSTSSTIVEALVYSSPDQPRRCLRHAGRNLALRNDSKDSRSRRSSSDSYESVHEHRLRHQRSPLPGRGFGSGRLTSNQVQARAASNPETMKGFDWPPPYSSNPDTARFALRSLSKPAKRLSHPNQQAAMPELEHLRLTGSHEISHNDRHTKAFAAARRDSSPKQQDVRVDSSALKLAGRQVSEQTEHSWPLPRATDFQEHHRRNDSVQTGDEKLHGLHLIRTFSGPEAAPPISSPRRGSLEPRMDLGLARHHFSSVTPLSDHSVWSDRTHNAEVNMATAVNIYPHNNESVLIIQQPGNGSSQRMSEREQDLVSPDSSPSKHDQARQHPRFEAFLQESTPPPSNLEGPRPHGVDSPLLNPRAAPEPPVFKFIPPTPNDDEDRQLGSEMHDDEPFSMNATEALPIRKKSLREKAVEHSSAILDAILLRQPTTRTYRRYSLSGPMDEARRRNLHPFWRPRGFWDDFDSDDEDYDDEPLESGDVEPLPRGGDTSDIPESETAVRRHNSKRDSFPRKMSKRLPGFRGSGGFLIGNSLGIGRHGTNNRRPHISLPLNLVQATPLRPRTSQLSSSSRRGTRGVPSKESLVRTTGGVAKMYRVPGFGAVQLRGLKGITESIKGVRRTHAERAAERRRERLRGMIGVRITHGA